MFFGRNPRRTLLRALGWGIFCIILFQFVLRPARTKGSSMEPTYGESGFTLINKLAYLQSEPKRGDVVAIRIGPGQSYMYMKRIVGLPGERLKIKKGEVFINDILLDEPYVKNRDPWMLPDVTLDSNEYYVIGDNRAQPMEFHRFGRVNKKFILGRVLF